MKRKTIGAIVVIAGLLAVGWWVWMDRGEPARPDSMGSSTDDIDQQTDRAAGGLESSAVDATTRLRDPAASGAMGKSIDDSGPARGALVVAVTWADGEPAVAVPVFVSRRDKQRHSVEPRRESTDAAGIARFTSLLPGEVSVSAKRAGDGMPKRLEIEAGQEKSIELTLELGVGVTGIVVDGVGDPVSGAAVVVTAWASGAATVLTQTDAEGRFALDHLGVNCSIGARAAGHEPSMLQGLTGTIGGLLDIRVVLPARGGGLQCTVLTPRGRRVAGARVRVGLDGEQNHPKSMAGGLSGVVIPQQLPTDRAGVARFAGVSAGAVPVAARLDGFSPWLGSAEVLVGRTTELTVRLEPLAVLEGTVRDAAGKIHAGVSVMVGGHGKLGFGSTRTDDEGHYRLEGIPLGEFRAEMQGDGVRRVTKLVGVAGETLRWDPELPATQDVPGRLLGPDGEGVHQARIEGFANGRWISGVTDGEGRFKLANIEPAERLRLTAVTSGSFFPVEVFDDQVPARGELVLRLREEQLPSVRLVGRLVDPDGAPVVNADLSPLRRGHGNSTIYKPEDDGKFDLGSYPPGEYRLLIEARGWANVRMPWRTATSDEIVDYGDIRLQKGGSVALQLAGAKLPEKPRVSVYDALGGFVGRIPMDDGRGSLGGLPGGSYHLQVRGEGLAVERVSFVIRGGVETPLRVAVQPGVPVKFVVIGATSVVRRGAFEVVDAAERSLIKLPSLSPQEDGSIWGEYGFVPGSYCARFVSDGRFGESEFTVAASGEMTTVTLRIP